MKDLYNFDAPAPVLSRLRSKLFSGTACGAAFGLAGLSASGYVSALFSIGQVGRLFMALQVSCAQLTAVELCLTALVGFLAGTRLTG